MTRLINQLISDEAVYRTAPATPGLLNICVSDRKLLKLIQFVDKDDPCLLM